MECESMINDFSDYGTVGWDTPKTTGRTVSEFGHNFGVFSLTWAVDVTCHPNLEAPEEKQVMWGETGTISTQEAATEKKHVNVHV